jgi:hypothetical protein
LNAIAELAEAHSTRIVVPRGMLEAVEVTTQRENGIPILNPSCDAHEKNAGELGRLLVKLDDVIGLDGWRYFTMCWQLIDCDAGRLMMEIVAQCLPIGIG